MAVNRRLSVVVAGNREEAMQWAFKHRLHPSNMLVVSSAKDLKNRTFALGAVVYIGTWLGRPDIALISEGIQVASARWERSLNLKH